MNKLEIQAMTVRFGHGRSLLTAVDAVDLAVPDAGTMGLVGESGSGKSTVAKAVVRLVKMHGGNILFDREDVTRPSAERLRKFRSQVQMVFQDPYSSLNPRLTIGEMLDEVVKLYQPLDAKNRQDERHRLLEMVGLDPKMSDRYPHQFSGGERQRIAIARALAVGPAVVVLDEVTASLDVSVQANILNLLKKLQRELGLAYLFISHNLSVVRYMSDVVSVMYLGQIVERAPARELFERPRHPYTRALIDSIPKLRARGNGRVHLTGEIPDPNHPPSGCRFRTRCPTGPNVHSDRTICIEKDPHGAVDGSHWAACHFPLASQH